MPGAVILSEKKDPDLGLVEFTFRHEDKPYTAEPKPLEPNENPVVMNARYNKLEAFLKYVKFICKKPDVNPFAFKDWKKFLTITPANKEPKVEQTSLFASNALDKIANRLENLGMIKEAYQLDIIANTIESCTDCNHVNLFSDEIQNQGIQPELAKKVLDIAKSTGVVASEKEMIIEKAHNKKGEKCTIIDFPTLRQAFTYDCGSAAVQMVLQYYGINEREKDIMDNLHTKKSGTDPNMIIKYFNKKGFKVKDGILTIKDLKEYVDKGTPVIIPLQAYPDKETNNWEEEYSNGHYVTVIGYTDDRIIFSDPASINETYLNNDDFMKRWHDMDNGKEKLINYGIVPYGKKPQYNSNKIVPMKA